MYFKYLAQVYKRRDSENFKVFQVFIFLYYVQKTFHSRLVNSFVVGQVTVQEEHRFNHLEVQD